MMKPEDTKCIVGGRLTLELYQERVQCDLVIAKATAGYSNEIDRAGNS